MNNKVHFIRLAYRIKINTIYHTIKTIIYLCILYFIIQSKVTHFQGWIQGVLGVVSVIFKYGGKHFKIQDLKICYNKCNKKKFSINHMHCIHCKIPKNKKLRSFAEYISVLIALWPHGWDATMSTLHDPKPVFLLFF